MQNTVNENDSLPSVTAFAHPFSRRNQMTPKDFSDECIEIREAVLGGHISVGQGLTALKSLQLQLNHAALQLAYQKLDSDQKLIYRMALLDQNAEPAPNK